MKNSGGLSSFITDKALSKPETFTFKTPGATLPVGMYFGSVYQKNPNLRTDFTPEQLQAVYGLPAAYKKGLDGKGQTIVLLEAYGYPTAEADANASFALTGLPLLTSSNFKIVYPEGKPTNPNPGVHGGGSEIALDIQWSHAIAPGAKILVVVAPGQDGEDFQAAMSYIVKHHLGNTVSDSWEVDQDFFAGPVEEKAFDSILERAAAKGISFQFSSGDGGDDGSGHPLGRLGTLQLPRMQPRSVVHRSSTNLGGQDSNRWDGAVISS